MIRSRLASALFAGGASLLLFAVPAQAAPQGDANAGDVWVDTAGQPSGPGHEMDPHLPCADIDVWGSGLADSTGTFTLVAQPPSGTGQQAYPKSGAAAWNYKGSGQHPAPSEVIAHIDINVLMDDAQAAGMTAQAQQGYHFKLDLSQDPQKHKVFWVDCAAPGGGGGGGGTPTPLPTETPAPTETPSPTPTGSPAPISATPTPVETPTPTATPTATPGGGVLGVSATPTPSGAVAGVTATGSVLGISTPSTGVGIMLFLGLALMAAGFIALAGARRPDRRRS